MRDTTNRIGIAIVNVNKKFRDIILDIAEPGDVIWVHDYQLLLLPGT